jgi:hypothetical protein
MEKGKIKSRGNVHWMPDGTWEPLVIKTRKKYEEMGAVLLPPYWYSASLARQWAVGYVCRKCGKMIVEFPQN